MNKQKTIGIDFDGTLCKKQSYGNGKIHEVPNEGAYEVMESLRKEGYQLTIFTVRLNPKKEGGIAPKKAEIERWLKLHNIPYDEVTNNKPEAVVYVDDRAIRFTNWADIKNYFIQ